jgi:hypothetical protein
MTPQKKLRAGPQTLRAKRAPPQVPTFRKLVLRLNVDNQNDDSGFNLRSFTAQK